MKTSSIVGMTVGFVVALLVISVMAIPVVDNLTTEIETNDNPGWLSMNYTEGAPSDFTRSVTVGETVTVGAQSGALSDMIIYAASNGSVFLENGTAYLISGDGQAVLSNSFDIAASSGVVTVTDGGNTYTLDAPEWAYIPELDGKYASFAHGGLIYDGKPLAAATTFAGSAFYNNMNEFELVMDAQTTSDTIESVKWVEDSEEQVVNPNLSPLDIALNPLNPGIGGGAIVMSADPSGATRVGDLYYTFTGTDATVAGFASGVNYGALTIPATIEYQETTYNVVGIATIAFRDCTSLTSVTIPSSVTEIGNYAFARCTSLTSVTIPSSVTTIYSMAFVGCTSLTAITVESGNATYSSDDGVLFNADKTTLVTYPAGKGSTYSIPGSVTEIGGNAFYGCTSLTSVTIPSSVTTIGGNAFYECTSLTSVTIPSSVTTILAGVFYGCTSLTSVIIPGSVTEIGGAAFYGCGNLTILNFSDIEIVPGTSYGLPATATVVTELEASSIISIKSVSEDIESPLADIASVIPILMVIAVLIALIGGLFINRL